MTKATLDLNNPMSVKDAPEAAFKFSASKVEFTAAGEQQSNSKPIRVLARTGECCEHWYWGRIVHDFAGMNAKPRIAFDWCHDQDDIVGVGKKTDISSGDLWIEGSIESLEAGDSADKIIKLSDRDVPYEASIYFDPMTVIVEFLGEAQVATVNGREIVGPCVIARQWDLRRVAICPSGADFGTETEFSAAEKSATRFSLNWKGQKMDEKKPENKTDQKPDGKSEFELKFEKFSTEFGAVHGNEYLKAGLTFEEAVTRDKDRQIAELKAANEKSATELAAAQTEREALALKLKQVDLGEQTAVDTGVGAGEGAKGKGDFKSNFTAARKKAKQ